MPTGSSPNPTAKLPDVRVLLYLPAVLLPGFMFPIANMPPAVQLLTLANPLRYFLIIRGIFLKGNGRTILWPQMLSLLIFGATVSLPAVCVSGSGWSRWREGLQAGLSLFRYKAAHRVDILAVHVP